MDGRTYNDGMTLQSDMNDILESIKPEIFVRVFTEWQRRLQARIEGGGLLIKSITRELIYYWAIEPGSWKGLSAPPAH
jgi:hypothetical protein